MLVSFAAAAAPVQRPTGVGRITFVLDGNRMYAEVGFIRPDSSVHRALAYVDMGSPTMTIHASLLKELTPDPAGSVRFHVGDVVVQVEAGGVAIGPRPPSSIGSGLKVEATLPASILQRYEVVIDYRTRVLVLAPPGSMRPQGVAVPFVVNPATGLVVVTASIAGRTYALTIDNGSAYTWMTQRVLKEWTATHREWMRGVGAVGPSNMMMSGDTTETSGILLRIPEITIGSIELRQVGALGAGPTRLIPGYVDVLERNGTRLRVSAAVTRF